MILPLLILEHRGCGRGRRRGSRRCQQVTLLSESRNSAEVMRYHLDDVFVLLVLLANGFHLNGDALRVDQLRLLDRLDGQIRSFVVLLEVDSGRTRSTDAGGEDWELGYGLGCRTRSAVIMI